MIRKIIHIDMDCFFAAIEMRDNPRLRNIPMAVGGQPDARGVIATCNYLAREFGVHSAMSSAEALRLCPQLKIVNGRFAEYRVASEQIREIFQQYTDVIEPISLDEAYLDVTGSTHCAGVATYIAKAIREQIFAKTSLTASAGIAPNKFLAKVASDWRKPNGQFTISPRTMSEFVKQLPVKKIPGVGKVTQQKLQQLNIHNCADLQQHKVEFLVQHFGKFGYRLSELAFARDQRPVVVERIRKSLSVEETFASDLPDLNSCLQELPNLFADLTRRFVKIADEYQISKKFLKLKYANFSQTTIEELALDLDMQGYEKLLAEAWPRGAMPVRLIGLGVRLQPKAEEQQLSLKL